MSATAHRSFSLQSIDSTAAEDATMVVSGADFLLTMVESAWAAGNGVHGKMEPREKTQHELATIAQQISKLQSATAGGDESTLHQLKNMQERLDALQTQVAPAMDAWEKTELARHPQRPYTLDYVERIFTDWSEIHGDRAFGDDHAIVCGMARFQGREVMVIGHQKARDTKQKVYRNFGMPNPEGYRKALRTMKLAEKFGRPVITFVDTPGAFPGLGGEERGQAEAIARNLREMGRLRVPIITTITGEGGSGGALAIAIADRVLMMQNSVYAVISPEGCASILWRDPTKKNLAAEAMRITAEDVKKLDCIDDIVPEPEGGAHDNHEEAANLLAAALDKHLTQLSSMPIEELIESRHQKFRNMAKFLVEA